MEHRECLMQIRVACQDAVSVKGHARDIVMIPFTAVASGPHFNGRTVGPGVDTQKIDGNGRAALSARYMLEGTDAAGNPCRVFVENEGSWDTGFRPTVVTDSPALKDWESARLSADIEGIPGGVLIRVFRED